MAGKWTALIATLAEQPGILITPDQETHDRLVAALPARDIRLDAGRTPGAIRICDFDNLPLHLYTRAESRRSRR